ncbi:MAG: SpoIIE family protein phosphatase [Bacteroidales bacterium]|nr:SpoIIE family protein phosphatase [Bacteroidales bacterium]
MYKQTITGILIAVLFFAIFSVDCKAHQIDDAGRMASLIKKAVETENTDFEKLVQLTDKINSYSLEEASGFFTRLYDLIEDTGDETTLGYMAVISGVYYLNRNLTEEALVCFLQAERYSHEQKRSDYICFLKAFCYMKKSEYSLIASPLENIMTYKNLKNNDFASVLYCESLRLMSLYYSNKAQKDTVAGLLETYCKMSDTLVCNEANLPSVYFPVPDCIKDKYFLRKAVDTYIVKEAASNDSKALGWMAAVVCGSLAAAGMCFLKYRKIKISARNTGTETAEEAFSPFAAAFYQSGNAVAVVGTDGKINYVNKSFEKLYGCSKDEFILSYGDNVFFSEKLKERCEAVLKCRKNLTVENYTSFITKDFDNEIWISGSVSPVTDKGLLKEYLIVETDVTDIKRETIAKEKAKMQIESGLKNAFEFQKILMPQKAEISRHFENFIIYSPKDFVSGDFYWFNKVGTSFVFALGDCVGHGLSGSMLGVLSTKTLEDIVVRDRISDPKTILRALDLNISKSLKQSFNGNQDGLDITVCKITPDDMGAEITVSGAKSYFFYRSQEKTVMLKGSRRSVGGAAVETSASDFENTSLRLDKGDCIYFSSDGIIDQNNAERKPLGRQRFLEILDTAAQKSQYMDIQQEHIRSKVETFRQGQPQRDDICVVGIKI